MYSLGMTLNKLIKNRSLSLPHLHDPNAIVVLIVYRVVF